VDAVSQQYGVYMAADCKETQVSENAKDHSKCKSETKHPGVLQ
jgi:hypothetical protein